MKFPCDDCPYLEPCCPSDDCTDYALWYWEEICDDEGLYPDTRRSALGC